MKIERFQYFVEVAKAGSITAAAKKCYISQTAMSQQMDALEQELGARLLERTKTGTSLTRAGALLLPRAETLLQDYRGIQELFARERRGEKRLTIAYTGPNEQQLLLRAIPEFHRLYADVDIQLRQRPMSAIEAELESGACDVALSMPGEISVKGYWHVIIMQKPICAAVSADSPLAGEETLSIERLKDRKMVLLRSEACVRASGEIRQKLLAWGWRPEQILYADTIENQLLMVNLDQGVTLVPEGKYPEGIRLVPLAEGERSTHNMEAVAKRMRPLCSAMVELLRQVARTM